MKYPELKDPTKRKDLTKLLKLSKAEVKTLDNFINAAELAETKPSVFGKGGQVMFTPAAALAVAVVAIAYQVAKDVHNSYLPDDFNTDFLNKVRSSIKEMHKMDTLNKKSGSLDHLLNIRESALEVQKLDKLNVNLEKLNVNLERGLLDKKGLLGKIDPKTNLGRKK